MRADKSIAQIPIPKCPPWQEPRAPSQTLPRELGAGFAGLSPLACLQEAGHDHAWIWGPSLGTFCQCPLKVQSGISWSGCSISTCTASTGCYMGGNPQAMVRAVCVVQLHQPSSYVPVSSFPFHLRTARCATKTNLELLCSQNSWERTIILFAFLVFRAGHHQWWLDRWSTRPPQRSFAAQEFPKQFSPFFTISSPKFLLSDPAAGMEESGMYCRCPVFLLPPATTVPAVLVLPAGAPTPVTVVLPHSLADFCQRKTSVLAGTKKMSWNCLQSGEIYYDRTKRAENEDASWKKKCSSLWWTVSGKVKANSDYFICKMALFQRLEGGYPTLWKSVELATGRVRWNLMRLKTNLWQLLASGNSPLKRNWPGNLPQSGLLKKSGLFFGEVQLGVFISDLASS